MVMRSLAFAACLSMSVATFSQDACTPIRLDQTSGPLTHSTVIDQGSLDVCQFATVADLIDASIFHSKNQRTNVSYVQLFTEYVDRFGLEGPYLSENIAVAARRAGACSTQDVAKLVSMETSSLCVGDKRIVTSLVGIQSETSGPSCSERLNSPLCQTSCRL